MKNTTALFIFIFTPLMCMESIPLDDQPLPPTHQKDCEHSSSCCFWRVFAKLCPVRCSYKQQSPNREEQELALKKMEELRLARRFAHPSQERPSRDYRS